jgi:prepilin-type N-terminal cleavage/methylation domain-containing protein
MKPKTIRGVHSTSQLSNKKAFTLVELLTVIAIILFLVGLLMPALNRVRETAKVTKCISNMRQISMATFLYASDNGGMAPFNHYLVEARSEMFTSRSHDASDPSYRSYYPTGKWFAEYLPGGAMGSMNPAAYCPKGGRFNDSGPMVKGKTGSQPNVSYGINPDLIDHGWFLIHAEPDRNDVPLQQIHNPAKVCLWIESCRVKAYGRMGSPSGRHFSTSKVVYAEDPIEDGLTLYQEYGQANVVYIDQHISMRKIPDELPDFNSKFWRHKRDDKPDPYWK